MRSINVARVYVLQNLAKLPPLLVVILCGGLAGCGSFNSEFRRAQSSAVSGIEGAYIGTWASESSGHHGRLRCVLTPTGTNLVYHARFRATWAKVFSFGYDAPLTMNQVTPPAKFEGESNLGKLAGGVYHYSGVVTGEELTSSYRASKDHGRFELKRSVATAPQNGSRTSSQP